MTLQTNTLNQSNKAKPTLLNLAFALFGSFLLISSQSGYAQDETKAEPEQKAEQTQKPEQDITPFKDDVQKSMYMDLVTELRCPKCQNQNIADSNAVIAQDMRVKTKELLDEGYSKQDVIDYMVNRYGQFAHYDPPLTLATSILWFVPAAFVLFCIVMLIQKSQGRVRQADADVARKNGTAGKGRRGNASGTTGSDDIHDNLKVDEAELDRELNALLDDRPASAQNQSSSDATSSSGGTYSDNEGSADSESDSSSQTTFKSK